jgi:hypothetical protein
MRISLIAVLSQNFNDRARNAGLTITGVSNHG